LTESSHPGVYRTASMDDTLGTADDYTYTRGDYSFYPCQYGSFTQLLEFKRTGLPRGQYTLWVCYRMYSTTGDATAIAFTEHAHTVDGTNFGGITVGRFISEDSRPSTNVDTPESCLNLYSGSQRAIVISNNPIVQGCMFAPTASWGISGTTYNFYGNKSGNHGRNYVLPFLIDSSSLVAGFCSASCNFWSGSKYCTASFTVGTNGKSLNDIVYASQSSLPAVANFWTTSVVVQGTPLASIPLRMDQTSSWIPFV